MFGRRSFRQAIDIHPERRHRIAAATALLLAFTLQAFDLRAELLFRSLEQASGQQSWSPVKKYGKTSQTADMRASAGAAAAPAQEVRVFLSGEITFADVDSAETMLSLRRIGKQKIAGNTVWLASNGGDIDAGMELGRLLRRNGIFTVVGQNDQCISACVFAFMGGERRSVAGRLGIHRPFFPFTQATPDRQARFRHLQRTLKDYVEEMDFPTSLYEAIMLVPPESIQIVAPADLKRFYLEGISPSSEDMLDAASARRLNVSMFEYLQRKARAPACAFFDTANGGCDGKVLQAVASGGAADDPGLARRIETASAERAMGRNSRIVQSPLTAGSTIRNPPQSSGSM